MADVSFLTQYLKTQCYTCPVESKCRWQIECNSNDGIHSRKGRNHCGETEKTQVTENFLSQPIYLHHYMWLRDNT